MANLFGMSIAVLFVLLADMRWVLKEWFSYISAELLHGVLVQLLLMFLLILLLVLCLSDDESMVG